MTIPATVGGVALAGVLLGVQHGLLAVVPPESIDEIGAIKELTAFAALLVIMLWWGRKTSDRLGEIVPQLSGLQNSFEKGAIQHKEALDRNTSAHERSEATLTKLVEQMHVANQATLANINALADRNLERVASWTRAMEQSLADLRLQLVEIKARLGPKGNGADAGEPDR